MRHEKDWQKFVQTGELILVCDVGGGTTDLTLVGVSEENGELVLQRLAVGNHLLVGGDNMDLTLAYAVRAKLAQSGTQIDNWQFRARSNLHHATDIACRNRIRCSLLQCLDLTLFQLNRDFRLQKVISTG